MALPQFNSNSQKDNIELSDFTLDFDDDNNQDDDNESGLFLGIGVENNEDTNDIEEDFIIPPMFNVNNVHIEEDDNIDDEDDSFSLELTDFELESDEDFEEPVPEEKVITSEETLKNYKDTLASEPDKKPEANSNYSKKQVKNNERLDIDNVSDDNDSLSPADFKLLTTHRTIYRVDMINNSDKTTTPLADTNVNRVTKKRDYSRDEHGILSPSQIRYFTTLSKVNLSNARYPEEYVNIARSNEEILDSGQRYYKGIVRDFISKGIEKDSKDRVAKYISKGVSRLDEEILELIARLKYMSTMQIVRATNRSQVSLKDSLLNLRAKKLIKNADSPYYNQRMWCLTDLGMSISNYDLAPPSTSGISISMLQHVTVVNNVAAHIHSGTVNVLGLEDFPPRNRVTNMGRIVAGDDFVSETQLRSSLGRIVNEHSFSGIKGDVYIPIIQNEINKNFEEWRNNGDMENGKHSPEREFGNEYMLVLFPPPYLGIYQHIPDLVVPRDRGLDGKPESIAVEVELRSKTLEDYIRTLKVYENDDRMYKKVVWICSKQRTVNMLIKAAEHTNLLETGRLEIMPIETENGVFKGNNVLAIG